MRSRDIGTFIVARGTNGVPAGNHSGYIDCETIYSIDQAQPFPHVKAVLQPSCYVLRVERSLHPECFAANDCSVYHDIDVSDFVRKGVIAYDQYAVPDILAAEREAFT
jgi:hypothetical protein